MNHNLYEALRAQFPQQLDTTAVETQDGLQYSWRDLERASAMLANLLEGLNIPKGARIAVQVEKSVEATDRKSTRLNSSHRSLSRMPSSA